MRAKQQYQQPPFINSVKQISTQNTQEIKSSNNGGGGGMGTDYSDYENDELMNASAYALSDHDSPDFYVHHNQQQRDNSPYQVNYDNFSDQHQQMSQRQSRNQQNSQGSDTFQETAANQYYLSPIQETQMSSGTQSLNKFEHKSSSLFQRQPNNKPSQKSPQILSSQSSTPKSKPTSVNQTNSLKQLRQTVEYLFVYYCDFNFDSKNFHLIFLKQFSFLKLLKDAYILHPPTTISSQHSFQQTQKPYKSFQHSQIPSFLSEKDINLLVTQEMSNPLLKSLDFQSFLNLLVKIAVIKYEIEEQEKVINPKMAVNKLLQEHIIPLLENIEEAIGRSVDNNGDQTKLSKKQSSSQQVAQITMSGQYITNISIGTLQMIEISDEEVFVLKSINNVMVEIYQYYFTKKTKTEHPLKTLLKFLKDFEVCPYLLNQKTSFMIYYFTVVFSQQTTYSKSSIKSKLDNLKQPLQSVNHNTSTFGKSPKPLGKQQSVNPTQEDPDLTYDHFLQIFYRIAIVLYDLNSPTSLKERVTSQPILPSAKKLLYTLTRLELTQGFTDFVNHQRQFKSINCQFTLTPPRPILIQLILNQQQFTSQQEVDYLRDVYLPERDNFMLCKIYIEDLQSQSSINDGNMINNGNGDRGNGAQKKQEIAEEIERNQGEMEEFLEREQERLVRIFQYYCSYGDPMNTSRMKSSKIVKLFSDAGLLMSNIKTMDKVLEKSGINLNKSGSSIGSLNTGQQLRMDRNELDLIFKKVVSQQQTNSISDRRTSFNRTMNGSVNHNNSSFIERIKSPMRDPFLNQTMKGRNYAFKVVEVSVDQTSLSFEQFKEVLFEASNLLMRTFPTSDAINKYHFFIYFMESMILPVLTQNDKTERYVFNEDFTGLLQQLENDEVLVLLSDLYQVIVPFFEQYTSPELTKGHPQKQLFMTFQNFVKFCTDFQIFPDFLNKSEMHKIFSNLAMDLTIQAPSTSLHNRSLLSTNTTPFNKSHLNHSFNNNLSHLSSTSKRPSLYAQEPTTIVQQVLDSHLFIQALAFCALSIDTSTQVMVLTNNNSQTQQNGEVQQEALEKLLIMIEKIGMAQESRRRGQGGDGTSSAKQKHDKIQGVQQDKIDIGGYFRKKYKWYFDMKSQHIELERTIKLKPQAFKALVIMDNNLKLNGGGSVSSRKQSTRGEQLSFRNGANSGKKNIKQEKTDLFSMVMQEESYSGNNSFMNKKR